MGRQISKPLFEVRPSPVHGLGVFALRRIRRGRRLIEYVGEQLPADVVDARYDENAADDPHTFLFRISEDMYVDASFGGNDARFINHSCEPNCEADVEGDRIVIRAIKDIEPGVELSYDYALEIEVDPSLCRQQLYACRCGAPRCRGTMIDTGSGQR